MLAQASSDVQIPHSGPTHPAAQSHTPDAFTLGERVCVGGQVKLPGHASCPPTSRKGRSAEISRRTEKENKRAMERAFCGVIGKIEW